MKFGLITGIPRSGTTLAAAIVEQYRAAFCLSEPDAHVSLSQKCVSAEDFVAALQVDLEHARSTLLNGGAVETRRAKGGGSVTNYFGEDSDGRGAAYEVIAAAKASLPNSFKLCAKHNALYTAVLPEIVASGAFAVVAIVREPFAVLRSWRSLAIPISKGRLPAGEPFWGELREVANSDWAVLRKQVAIIELFCRRYQKFQNSVTLLRYDELIRADGALEKALGIAVDADEANLAGSLIKPQQPRPRDPEVYRALRDAADAGSLSATLSMFPSLFEPHT